MVLLVANWKMAPDSGTLATALAKKTNTIARSNKKKLTVVACTPAIHLGRIKKDLTSVRLGAQTVAGSKEVAQTGLVGASMLKNHGVSYCIVGHSESRARGETNEDTALQVNRLLEQKITPIVCVGETTRDSHGWYLSVIKDQLEAICKSIPKNAIKNLVIAYEPVWAIGKDALREATPVECGEMTLYIRKVLADLSDEKTANALRVLYGGSVDEGNARGFLLDGGAQGFLVGRVSLDAVRFGKLARNIAL